MCDRTNFDWIVITHSDLDGVGCAVLLKAIARQKKVFIQYASNYIRANEMVKEAIAEEHWEKIFITDLSVPRETAKMIDKDNGFRVTLLDHHPGIEWLDEYKWATVRPCKPGDVNGHCGTSLVYEYCKEHFGDVIEAHFHYATETIDKFVETVRRYDLWLWKTAYNDEFAKDLNDYLGIVGFVDFVDKMWDVILSDFKPILSVNDYMLLKYRQREIDNYIKGKIRKVEIREIEGYKVGFVIADRSLSELGNRMMEEIEGIDLALMVNLERGSVSLRSIEEKNVDCTALAKKWFGGGGHKLASGGELSEEKIKEVKDILFSI